ncbi:MAG: F0F1 ATP synthase subunit gamma [Pirellulaceae bacterium]
MLDDFLHQSMGSLFVVSARFEGAGRFSPIVTQILPIRPTRIAVPLRSTAYQSQYYLVAVAVREYLYTTLHELLLDALAAEFGMRLIAAESARHWLDDTVRAVRRQLSARRREGTTQEVLDIVSGARYREANER